jgi:hypothetical protein
MEKNKNLIFFHTLCRRRLIQTNLLLSRSPGEKNAGAKKNEKKECYSATTSDALREQHFIPR